MFPKKKKKGIYQCTKCPKKFSTKNSRNCHERNHNKQPKFDCPHCEQKFFFEFVRDKHIIKEHADVADPSIVEEELPCGIGTCPKKFQTEALRRMHRSRKHGVRNDNQGRPDKPVPCDICGKEVLWLNEHKKSLHPELMGEQPEHHECPECGKVMKYASSLKRHMYIHQDGGAVNCPHCDKQFNHPSSLWGHFPSCPKMPPKKKKVPTANTTKKYKRKPKNLVCEICNKSFTNLRNYKNHVDNHLGKYKHICGHCGKKFQNTNHYSDHMNRHYGIKNHVCPHCERTFASKSDMRQHMRQHTGERPFACPICNRTFVHRSNCYAHARKAHNKDLANNPELARMCKLANRGGDDENTIIETEIVDPSELPGKIEPQELVEEEETSIIVVTEGTEKELLAGGEHSQEVQIAELLLAQNEKGQPYQLAPGQAYTTIQTDSGTGGLSTVLVPQYMYSQQGDGVANTGNIYTTTVNSTQEFTQQQQQNAGELKFCLYEG